MRSQFVPLLLNEAAKAARRTLPYFGIFALGLANVVTYFAAGHLTNAATENAWGYVGFSMQMVFSDVGPILIVTFAARLMAEETGTGTIRSALAAPVYRWEFYVAKAVIGLLYMMVFSAAALLFSVALAGIHYRFGPIGDSAGIVYSRNQAMQELLAAYALSWIPLGALVMYGLLISTLIRTTGEAVSVAIATLIVIDLTKHLAGLDPYIFTRHITYPWLNLLQMAHAMDYQWRPEVWKMIELSGVSAVIMFVAGLIIFTREDLNH